MLIQTAFALAALMPAAQSAASQPTPRLEYQSPLSGYRRIEDPPRADWPAANHEVHRIGGWQAYARMSQPNSGAAPSSAAAANDTHKHGQIPGAPHQGMHRGMQSGKHEPTHNNEPMHKDKHQHTREHTHRHDLGRAPAPGGGHQYEPVSKGAAKPQPDTDKKDPNR